jgi:hypothetical protein
MREAVWHRPRVTRSAVASGLEHKYHYEIIGHSGESHKITFVGPGSVTDAGSSDGMPRTRGDRLAVVQEMYSRE